METQTRGKETIDCRLQGSMRTLDDVNPTKLSKQSQGCSLTENLMGTPSSSPCQLKLRG